MRTAIRLRALAGVGALALAIASCAEPPPPPPPPAPPPVALSPSLIEQASAYRGYMTRATAISPAFTEGSQVDSSVKVGAAYEPGQLLRGALAYGAVAALQDEAFVAAVRAQAADPARRQQVAYEIFKDPGYAVGFNGASSAAGLVTAAFGEDGRRLFASGQAVKQAAYDVQRSKWSKGEVANRVDRLSQAKTLSATPAPGDLTEAQRLEMAVQGAAPLGLTADPAAPPYSPMVVRSLALAALAVLGYGGENHMSNLLAVTAEPNASFCLNMSKLNLYQCLAVSKPYYEDVFCLGQHVMMDTGKCLMKGAGVPDPLVVAAEPLKVAETEAVTKASTTATIRPAPKKP